MADTLTIGERRLPVSEEDDADPAFLLPVQTSDTEVSNEGVTPILQQPIYAETDDYALTDDLSEDDAATSTDDSPLAILPDDEYDGLFAELDGSLLDELLTV